MLKTLYTFNLPVIPAKLNMSGIIAYITVTVVLFLVMTGVKDIPTGEAVIGSLIGLALLLILNHAHQMGHATAAKQTGYPMVAWRSFFIICTSIYPDDEPELPAEVHIRRALGGQYFSLPLFIVGILAAFVILPDHGVAGVLAVYFLIVSFAFSLGALVPAPYYLEFDGNTIMEWWPKRGQSAGKDE